MNKNGVILFVFLGIATTTWFGYYIFIGQKKVDPKKCITSGQWQLKQAYLDSFLYINDPNKTIAPQLLKHIDVTDLLINKKNIVLDLNIEPKGFGMYGDAKITYTGTPISIAYSASAPGTKTSGYCKDFIKLNFGSWLLNNKILYDTLRDENRINIVKKSTQNFESIFYFNNDTLTCNIGYSSYDHQKTFSNYIDFEKVFSIYKENKDFVLKWVKVK